MINFNNGVTNVNETPGINANAIENRPAATVVPIGTIFISTNTNTITRSNGTNWVTIGGGGSTPGIDSVLAVNQQFTQHRQIDINNQNLLINDSNNPNANKIDFNSYILTLGSPNVYGALTFDLNGLKTTVLGLIKGFSINPSTQNYNFGDEEYFLQVDAASKEMRTYLNGDKYGFEFDWTNYIFNFGDYANNNNHTYIQIDDSLESIILTATDQIGIGISNVTKVNIQAREVEFQGALLESNTSSGNSGKHLKITVNGAPYKLKLENP
jgi:hypothetical protein